MEILQRALREALDRNAAETVRWSKYKEQHEIAKVSIEEFRKSLEVDIMVPIGSKALMPGRLYHTNEIVVSHSGTYYSKCSAHKALEICQNRLNVAESRLKALEVEADLHRNQLELPLDFDAFSSQEIIETYDEQEEKTWQLNHKMKVKEQKRKEAIERQQLLNGTAEDDIVKRLEELELMEELENELEAISEEDDEAVQAILSERPEQISCKSRISHFNERSNENVSASIDSACSTENESLASDSTDDDDGDDDEDIPVELKELELKAASMTKRDKVKLFKAKLDENQKYVENLRPRTLEEISHKTDMIFLSDHLLNAIEMMEDEIKCNRYLNEENVMTEDWDNDTSPPVIPTSVPKQTILKKTNSLGDDNGSMESREKPSRISTKKIRFANEDHVKSFDVLEEPSKISSTVIYDHGPVLNLNVNHSEAVFTEANEQSDIIRSPVDIYKQFVGCTPIETKKEPKARVEKTVIKSITNRPTSQPIIHTPVERPSPKKSKEEPRDTNVVEAKTEVKDMLDNMFGTKNANEPDPLPEGSFVDAHQPKKRVSLFKQRRQMKSQ